jgi:hypothetical protein
MDVTEVYPRIPFRPRSHNWLARLMHWPAECEHLDKTSPWMATFIPDAVYLRGKAKIHRHPSRPEISVCWECLHGVLRAELEAFEGRMVAFEPDPESLTQYFFVGREDFADAGLLPEVASAIERRLHMPAGNCRDCDRPATWLWISQREVSSLDQVERIASSGAMLCAVHGAANLMQALGEIEQANLFYVNAPYGDAGAYLWI